MTMTKREMFHDVVLGFIWFSSFVVLFWLAAAGAGIL